MDAALVLQREENRKIHREKTPDPWTDPRPYGDARAPFNCEGIPDYYYFTLLVAVVGRAKADDMVRRVEVI